MKRLHRPRSTTYNQPAGKEDIANLHARIQREIALAQEDGDSKTFFNKLTRLSLSVLGYDESAIETFINNLPTQVTKPRAKINGLLEEKQTAILHDIITSTQEFLENRKKLALIIKAQSIARGWLVRKRFKNISKETFNTLRSRNQVFGELLKTEHQYKESIETIIKDYLEPVRSSLIEQKPLMETQDTAIVFCNIETIHQTHSKIIESLNELTSDWPFVDGVGQVFLRIAPSLKVYGVYVQNFKLAMDTLDRLTQTKGSRWKAFLDAKKEPIKQTKGGHLSVIANTLSSSKGAGPSFGSMIGKQPQLSSSSSSSSSPSSSTTSSVVPSVVLPDIRELLKMPLDRIAKYESFLQEIERTTPPNHNDWKDIVSASALMKQTSAFVQQALEQADQRAKILGVQRRLIGYEGPLNLLEAKREFCFEGHISVTEVKNEKSKSSKRYLFLFNNLIIFTKHLTKGYQVKKLLHLSSGDEIKDQPDTASSKHNVLLLHRNEKYLLSGKSIEEKGHILAYLTISLQQQKRDRVFGIPLIDLLDRDKTQVPKIVEDIISLFEANPEWMKLEGIFRQSGLKDIIEDFKTKYNQREKVDLSQARTPHDLSGLLKAFLRELPEPLFPFSTYTKLMSLYDELNGQQGVPTETGLNSMTEICQSLPLPNKRLLKFLCAFLTKVTNYSEENKMTTHNISIVFGPNLIRPAVETIETSLALPIVNFAFKTCVENWERFFGDSSSSSQPRVLASATTVAPSSSRSAALTSSASSPPPSTPTTSSVISSSLLVPSSSSSTSSPSSIPAESPPKSVTPVSDSS